MKWNEKVKELMDSKGINQKELSRLSGVTESSISRYLTNDKAPRFDIVANIARALDVSVDLFLDEDQKCESAYVTVATAIARNGNELSIEEKNKLILLLIGKEKEK